MFVTIKSLTRCMDYEIGYVEDAKKKHYCSEQEFQEYMHRMASALDRRLNKLKEISSNQKLIDTYTKKIDKLFRKEG